MDKILRELLEKKRSDLMASEVQIAMRLKVLEALAELLRWLPRESPLIQAIDAHRYEIQYGRLPFFSRQPDEIIDICLRLSVVLREVKELDGMGLVADVALGELDKFRTHAQSLINRRKMYCIDEKGEIC